MTQTQEVTREGMKIMALTERVAQLTADYENKIADLRVELTIVSQELQARKDADVPTETAEDPSA